MTNFYEWLLEGRNQPWEVGEVVPDEGKTTTTEGTMFLDVLSPDGKTLGYMNLYPMEGNDWFVGKVGVTEEARRQGISTALHDKAYKWVSRQGGRLHSGMLTSNAAKEYWKKLEKAGEAESLGVDEFGHENFVRA